MKSGLHKPLADAQLMAALPTIESVRRLGSFARAARELKLSQSALSRRISALEQTLGVTLFARRGRALEITDWGRELAAAGAEAMRVVERARRRLGAPLDGTIRVGALPSIGGLWLTPRLPRFLDAQPNVRVSVALIDADFADERKDPVTWDPSSFDVVLTWGRGGWRSLQVFPLVEEHLSPVCSPECAERFTRHAPGDLWRMPLLAHTSRGNAWKDYARARGGPAGVDSPSRLQLEHFFMLLEAVRVGAGVALLPDLFVRDDVRSGRLVTLAPSWSSGSVYAAVAEPAALRRPPVEIFLEWLQTEAAAAK